MKIFTSKYWDLQKPQAETAQGWREWAANARRSQPLPYFVQETLPDWFTSVQRKVTRPFSSAVWWIRYRTTDRNHVLRTGMTPGYHDKPELMLHVNFQLLVDFVEIECANMATIFLPQWWDQRKPRWKRWLRIPVRNPEAGVAYLLEPLEGEGVEEQIRTSREIVDLYRWWTQLRPRRVDPFEHTGWNQFCQDTVDIFDLDTHDQDKSLKIIRNIHDLEEHYLAEDQAQLARLVAVRMNLWT